MCCWQVYRCQRERSCALVYRLRICTQILLWEPESAECIQKTSRPTKWKEGVGGSGIGGEAYECINSLQKLEFNLRGARKFGDKKVALQRSYHSVSRLVSWSDNSRRSQAGSLLPFDDRFPTFSAATDELMAGSLYFSLCRGCCQTLLQQSAILSVIKPLRDTRLQTPSTSKTLHYSVSLSQPVSVHCGHLQDIHATVSRAKLQETWTYKCTQSFVVRVRVWWEH